MIKKGLELKEDRESKIMWRYKTIEKFFFFLIYLGEVSM